MMLFSVRGQLSIVLCLMVLPCLTPALAESPPDSIKKTAARADRSWWSLQPIKRPAVPDCIEPGWRVNPIDAFIKIKLEENQISANPEVDRRGYIRRVTLDLTGLLPTPEEINSFVKDGTPNAHEKLVDRLLDSSAYGERWGRHWLDVVRFAESHGYEMNQLRANAWPYRDYVIRAFNRDTPYPRFVLEQLAGDAVPGADFLSQAATGFLVAGPHDQVENKTVEGALQIRSDDLFDMVSTTSNTFLGITVGCARCHDHKFDPVSQLDFYRMQAVFAGVAHGERAIKNSSDAEQLIATSEKLHNDLLHVEYQLDLLEPEARPAKETIEKTHPRSAVDSRRNVERFAPVEARFIRLTIRATNDGAQPCIDELEIYGPADASKNLARSGIPSASSEYPGNAIHKIWHLNDGSHGNDHSWISNEAGAGWAQIDLKTPAKIDRIVWGRDRTGRYTDRLPTNYSFEVSNDALAWRTVASSTDRASPGMKSVVPSSPERDAFQAHLAATRLKIDELEKSRRVYAGVFQTPEATHLLVRGDVLKKGEEVGPAGVHGIGKAWTLATNSSDQERRRGLADWLTDPTNPLPARVMVNRVWHYHFSQGIVRTPSDFGFNGNRPSHPELLDWLAAEYQANGWKLKPLHRLIVLSKTYRQSSRIDPEKAKLDAGNRFLWRYPSHRLEAEAIRDAILQTSGALDRAIGGPGYHLWDYSGYVVLFSPKPTLARDAFRRMVYQFKPRLQQDKTFGVFDCPDGTGATSRRSVSTSALQALNLLNDEFIHEQAKIFGERLRRETNGDTAKAVRRAFMLAYGRAPSALELQASAQLVDEHGLHVFCRALFNTSEFVMLE